MPLNDTTNDIRSPVDTSNGSFKLPLNGSAYSLRSGDGANESKCALSRPKPDNNGFKTPGNVSTQSLAPRRRLNRSFDLRYGRILRSSERNTGHSINSTENLFTSGRHSRASSISSSSVNLPPIQAACSSRSTITKNLTDSHSSLLSLFNTPLTSANLPSFSDDLSECGSLFKVPSVISESVGISPLKRKNGAYTNRLNLSCSSLASFSNIDISLQDPTLLAEIDEDDLFFHNIERYDPEVRTNVQLLQNGIDICKVPIVVIERLVLPNVKKQKKHRHKTLAQEDPEGEDRVECLGCSRNYKHKLTLSRHMTQKCYAHIRLRCVKCAKTFFNKKSLESHMTLYCGKKWASSYKKCPKCKMMVNSNISLQKHIEANCSFICMKCKKSFRHPQGLDSHMRVAFCQGLQCSDCFRYFTTKNDLTKHASRCTKIPKFQCQKCGLHYDYKHSLWRHKRLGCLQRIESKQFQCVRCPKSYKRKDELDRHYQLECGDKRSFPCTICNYKAKHKHHLIRHLTSIHH